MDIFKSILKQAASALPIVGSYYGIQNNIERAANNQGIDYDYDWIPGISVENQNAGKGFAGDVSRFLNVNTAPTGTPMPNPVLEDRVLAEVPGGSIVGGGSSRPLNQAAVNATNSSLGQLDEILRQGLASQQSERDQLIRRYDDERTQQQSQFDTNSATNQQNYNKNLMQSLYAGSEGLQGLLKMLRGSGAAFGTARDLAGRAVEASTNRDISGGAQTFDENRTSLDAALNSFMSLDENRRRQADRTLENNQNALRANTIRDRQAGLNRLAELFGEVGNTSEAQRYAADAIKLDPQITRLSNTGIAEYAPVENTVQTPGLSQFNAPTGGSIVSGPSSSNMGSGIFTLGDFRKRLQTAGA